MENFQTDAGLVETVDASDDEVREAVVLKFGSEHTCQLPPIDSWCRRAPSTDVQ